MVPRGALRSAEDEECADGSLSPPVHGPTHGMRRIFALLSLSTLVVATFGSTAVEGVRAEGPAAGIQPARDEAQRQAERFFEEQVRPLLAARCFDCHGPDLTHPRSGLALASRERLLRGGHRGPSVVPGHPDQSLLVQAVRRVDEEWAMPPDEPLSASEVAILERWVALGAPWPDGVAGAHGPGEEALAHWAWQPPRRIDPPDVAREDLVREPIDRFVLARLEAEGLEPNPPASDRELVRRVHVDLLGLPARHEDVERYLADPAPDKWERLIDELLARPEYGERWGRRWLDVVRFAQTNGYERDTEKPRAGGYRDYVIRAFEQDKPYDRFLLEQLAGDELEPRTRDSLAATGFYRLGSWDSEPDDRLQAEMDELDDILATIGEGLLGVTIGCARCHDHLTDPILQEDYYRLLAFVRNVQRWSRPKFALDSKTLHAWDPSPEDLERWERDRTHTIAERRVEYDRRLAAARTRMFEGLLAEAAAVPASAGSSEASAHPVEAAARPASAEEPSNDQVLDALDAAQRLRLYLLQREAEMLEHSFEGDLDWLLVVGERDEGQPTHVLARGNVHAPLAAVEPGFPPILCAEGVEPEPWIAPARAERPHAGRRLALAEWIASPEHPTTARVMANRIWQGHFGRGLAPTPNDLGSTGEPPTHPELLDWLAREFVEGGWSVKALHRRILRSYTYRMSSRAANADALERDPANHLLWRQELRRLDAEALRDALLAVSGDLVPARGGRGFFPRLAREVLAGASKPGEGWELSPEDDLRRRSVYTFVKRGMAPPLLEAFDLASPNASIGRRPVTTTATQALALLNDEFVDERARSLAERVWSSVSDADPGAAAAERVRALWRRVLAREPAPAELELALEHLERQEELARGLVPALRIDSAFPPRLQVDFLESAPDSAFLRVPAGDWRVLRGRWGNEYNDTREVDPAIGPVALPPLPEFADALVRLRIRLDEGCELAGVLLRASERDGEPVGLELVLDAALGEWRLVELLGPGLAPRVLADAPLDFTVDRTFELVLELRGAYLGVRREGQTSLESARLGNLDAGALGLRALGGALVVEGLSVRTAAGELKLGPEPIDARRVAFESLALALLNANEFVYVD